MIECTIRLQFPTTINEVEYVAVFTSLDLAKEAGVTSVVIYSDSQVIIGYINRDYEAKGERMKEYQSMVKERISQKFLAKFVQISRGENEQANRLAKAASAEHMVITGRILSFVQNSPAIAKIDIQVIPTEAGWTTPIISYLRDGTLLQDHNASRRLKVQSSCFVLMGDILYKRGFSRLYLRCLVLGEADYVMKEIHKRVCGNHSGARLLVHKLIRAGYYWSIMQKDTQSYVKACNKCQCFSNTIRQPLE